MSSQATPTPRVSPLTPDGESPGLVATLPVSETTDAVLMVGLARGDIDALGILYVRYGAIVRSVVLRIEPAISHQEAEDLTQETFLTLHQTADRYREMNRLKSWLCGIAVRKTRGWRRRTWVRRSLLQTHRQEAQDIAGRQAPSPGIQAEARVEMERALASLPADQRDVLVMHTIEGLSGEEIATALGIRINTVWTRLHRARRRLQPLRQGGEPS